jgi:ABC-type oligopeptide transport system substrate-binding subunit/class 3 adenylate cyclase
MQVCPNCQAENASDAQFCQQCGQPLERQCSNCSTLNEASAKFCKKCGANLHDSLDEIRLQALRQAVPEKLQGQVREASEAIEGQRKPVTILFADIVGSTAMAESLDPEEWKEIVSGAHQRVSDAVYRYEGTIAQLLGDGVLAFFGAPLTHEDDPVRALHAALGIQEAMEEYQDELHGLVDSFQMRVGINSGTVVIGQLGSDMHLEYLAIGDAVNLAARLQSAAQPGGILISEATARLSEGEFALGDAGVIEVKGVREPVQVYRVLRAAPGGKPGEVTPLVGRSDELQELEAAIRALRDGHGQIVVVTGDAGIGKSRLVEEIHARASGELHWLEGRSLSYGSGLSYWTITQLLLADLGLSEGEPEARIKVTLRKRVADLFEDQSAQVFPYLAHLLGLKLDREGEERIQALDGETMKHQTILAVGDYFERAAAHTPTVLAFEDLHWVDPSSLEVLEHLFSATDRSALMLLLITRVERDHRSWMTKVKAETDYGHRYTEIPLRRLTEEQSDALVGQLLQIQELPTSLHDLILSRSEGNPFYLEEIIRHLVDHGVIHRENGDWHFTEGIDEVIIPDTVQGVLLARFDRLEEQVRETLQLASVIGRSFLYRLLEAIAEAERHLETHLSQLQRVDLVREKARWPELEYIFKHSLTQEAAYHSLLLERRKTFHLKVGEAIEELFADRQEEFYGLLAHHFEAAGVNDKAIDYLLKAGDRGRQQEAHQEAIEFYQRALKLLPETGEDERTERTWFKLGLIYQLNFDYDAALEANEHAFALSQRKKGKLAQAARRPPGDPPRILRQAFIDPVRSLDPAIGFWYTDTLIQNHLFTGLARIDSEMNVVPDIARSWEVTEGGTRYLFHLRDDVYWTNGEPVTAQDVEWAWKRNLSPETASPSASLISDVAGARAYHTGEESNPDSVGIQALDDHTFEVRLDKPLAYFLYLVAQPVAFPLPRKIIEQNGDEWWKPEHIVSHGPFQLVKFGKDWGELARSSEYSGDFPGNLDGLRWQVNGNQGELIDAYREGKLDVIHPVYRGLDPEDIPVSEKVRMPIFSVLYMMLHPGKPPLDDVRVRKALIHALDLEKLGGIEGSLGPAAEGGGVIPPGMAGYSPDLGLRHDLARARELLAEVGFSTEAGFSQDAPLSLIVHQGRSVIMEEIARQWKESLGVSSTIHHWPAVADLEDFDEVHVVIAGWSADYPDPDNFLTKSHAYRDLISMGWKRAAFGELIERAATTADRPRRLAMYREADRLLVEEEAVVVPLYYGDQVWLYLVKPWVSNYIHDARGGIHYTQIMLGDPGA